jgi:gamma-glutamyltranspeptidase/glutathione hydrolase
MPIHLVRVAHDRLVSSLAIAVAFASVLGCAQSQQVPAVTAASLKGPVPAPPFGPRSVVHAKHGMVAAAHPLAVQVGVSILQRGGSAVDAAIATNAVLGVLEPMMCGIGGDLFALVWHQKEKKLHGLNASGRAPRAIAPDKVTPDEKGDIPLYGPASWTVPGAVGGWFALHERFGKLPVRELLAPAIAIAREGGPIPRVIAAEWRASGFAGYAETFLPAPREGDLFKNPALARSYELIATGGADAYYKGPIAAAIVDFSRKHGGFFAPEDFAQNRPDWVQAISTDYRSVTVWELPPNGQGLAVLQMLNVLENVDLRAMGRDSPDFWHTLIEAKKLVFEDRAVHYAAPEAMKFDVARLIDKGYAKRRAALIDPSRAALRVSPGLVESDTTYLTAADAEGNMISLIQSNYHACGSGWVPDGVGFCLQNRGAQFSLEPGTPNLLVGGKRPFHTIIPGFATRGGEAYLAFGVMGGDFQPQGHVQILVNLIDHGMDLQAAGDASRFRHTGSTEPAGAMTPMADGGTVFLEPGVPEAVRAELVRRGHRFGDKSSYGGYQAIMKDPRTGLYVGATESRKDGCALGY